MWRIIQALMDRGRTGSFVVAVVVAWAPVAASAHERLLRCVTSPALSGPGHHRQPFAQRRFYAPVNSAMFFSHKGSVCRWKSGQDHHG